MSAPQILAALILGITTGYHIVKAVKIVLYAVQAYGPNKIFTRLRGVESGSVFVNLATTLAWTLLLAWGGFWS